MKKDKINVDELNNVINTGSKILRLFYAFMIVALVAIGILVLRQLDVIPIILKILSILSPFFTGFIIAWLLNPLVKMLTDRNVRKGLAVSLVYLLLAVVLYLICLAMIPALIDQINDMVKMVPDFVTEITDWGQNVIASISKTTNIDMSSVQTEFMNYIDKFGTNLANDLPSTFINVIQGLISGVGQFFIAIVIAFYLSLNFGSVNKHIINVIPKKAKADVQYLFNSMSDVLYRFVNGTLWMSLLLLVISIIGFSLIGLKAPVLFALFCAITNIIPYIGPYIGAAPAILVGFSQSPLIGILVAVFIFVVQTIEGNILHPIVIGKQMDLHPITIILSLLIFEYFFGIIGMIIATPLVAMIKIVYLFFDEKYDFFGFAKEKSVKKEISKAKLFK